MPPRSQRPSGLHARDRRRDSIKRWIWLYFWLLIFEGALRKWVLPQASNLLLIIRDPIVLIIYWKAYRWNRMRATELVPFAIISIGLTALACLQVIARINTPLIAAYGLRSYLLHIPMIYVMARALNSDDVKHFGRAFLLLSIPMAVLIFAQYQALPDALINVGAGEDLTQLTFAGGHVRASGTFSYVTGTTWFLSFVCAFTLYGITCSQTFPKWMLWSAAVLTLAAFPAVGSRTAMYCLVGMIACTFVASARSLKTMSRLIALLTMVCIGVVLLLVVAPQFRDASETFQARWIGAEDLEGGVKGSLNTRVLGNVQRAFTSDPADTASVVGMGLGMGSNVAAVLKSGSPQFLLAEDEWQRVIQEFGPTVGLIFMGLRVIFCANVCVKSFQALRRGFSLSWFILSAVAPVLVLSPMEQPTNLGFMVFGSGLCLTALCESGCMRQSARRVMLSSDESRSARLRT